MRGRFCRLGWAALATCACAPGVSPYAQGDPHGDGEASPAAGPPLEVEIAPHAPLDAAPRVLRMFVRAPDGSAIQADAVHLLHGEATEGEAKSAKDPPLSKTLAAREVAVVRWWAGGALVVAPAIPLRPGEVYTLIGAGRVVARLHVAEDDAVPLLSLVWPPKGRSPSGLLGVWCGAVPLAPTAASALLDPDGIAGVFRSGIAPGDGARACLHFEPALGAASGGVALAPPVMAEHHAPAVARLDPFPLLRDETPPDVAPALVCGSGRVPFGPGCAEVLDDRILVDTPGAPLLWSANAAGGLAVVAATAGESRYFWPLEPDTTVTVALTFMDPAGAAQARVVKVTTRPPMAHLVVTEVMAYPNGPQPEQEWIEIFNDGLAAASLVGAKLATGSGATELPPMQIGPGRYALLVNASYDADGDDDPPPAVGCDVVRLPRLDKNGLSNEGEMVELRDAAGVVLSHFPAVKAKKGRSVQRLGPKSLYEFALSVPGGSTPCAPNTLGAP
jgi:hypothetical protein